MRAWVRLKKSFGTGNVNVASTSGHQRARASLSSARTAKALTGIDHDKTSALWRLGLDDHVT